MPVQSSTKRYFKLTPLMQALLLSLISGSFSVCADTSVSAPAPATSASGVDVSGQPASTVSSDVESESGVTEFNTDVMDVKDRSNIDMARFARSGYVMPGDYPLTLIINGSEIREITTSFIAPLDDPHGSVPCLTPETVALFGLKTDASEKVRWWKAGTRKCLDVKSLPGLTARGDLGSGSLQVSIPQAYLEYSSPDWDPPSRWDDGVAGLLFDYNVNGQHGWQTRGNDSTNISGNGVAGMNLGPWRLRADWQAQRYSSAGRHSQSFGWNRYYLYRALPGLGAKLTLGETDLDSGLFDSFRFAGGSLVTDDSMLPPNLQGYAPEVTGVAKTNAKVVISQQGRVIYQTQVAPGPFRIQDLNDAVSGKLDVRVEEDNGSVQTFQVDTATIPYLTRPGMFRWKIAGGRPTDWRHTVRGDTFGTGEFSWGISNGWSLFGGVLAAQKYAALAVGIGRDLMTLGALSLDVTQSRAQLPNDDVRSGDSYRLSYSKRFEEIDGQVTFAGYRFSQRNFMTMSEYLDTRYRDVNHDGMTIGHSKELYTITVNKQFRNADLTVYGNYSHQTYWDRPDGDRWSVSLSKNLDIGDWRNISVSLTGYRTQNQNAKDDGVYASVSVPWSNGGFMNYSGQTGDSGTTHAVGWSDTIDRNNSYSLQAGTAAGGKTNLSGYYTHDGDLARMNLNTAYQEGRYSSLGMSLQGGATATMHGAALHRVSSPGSTRLMLDTGGVADVPVEGNGGNLHSNHFGKVVVADMNSYWRSRAGVDVNSLGDNVDVSHPLTQLTLTEGAIGYRKLDVISGRKMMANLRLPDGNVPSFGASVMREGHEAGVVGDNGSVWLTGITPGAEMTVREDGQTSCRIVLPQKLPVDTTQALLLPCTPVV